MARFSYTQSWISVDPSAVAAISAKNGRLSMLSPGNGIGWILSSGACSWDGWMVMSTSRVLPLAAGYSAVWSNSRPMPSSSASSISMNSIGTRRTVISEPVTMAAVTRLIASIGSSDGE